MMIVIRFASPEDKKKALAYLMGRFSFTSFSSGEMLVPEAALSPLAIEDVHFNVEGPATYERLIPALRNSTTPAVQ